MHLIHRSTKCLNLWVCRCRDLMDNKVFFQHPDLMRALCVHETVMQLMVNTLKKAQLQQQASVGAAPQDPSSSQSQKPPHSSMDALTEQSKVRWSWMASVCVLLTVIVAACQGFQHFFFSGTRYERLPS